MLQTKTKNKKRSKLLRIRSITEAQLEQHSLTFIRANTTDAEWENMKIDRVYETELGKVAKLYNISSIESVTTGPCLFARFF